MFESVSFWKGIKLVWVWVQKYVQSLAKKSVFLLAQITKIAVAPMICKIHKWYVPHMKDLKVRFDMTFKLLRKVKVKRVLGWILKMVFFQQKWCKSHNLDANEKISGAFHNICQSSLKTKFQKKIFICYKVIQLWKLCNFGPD